MTSIHQYNFKSIVPVPQSKDFIDICLSRTNRKTPTGKFLIDFVKFLIRIMIFLFCDLTLNLLFKLNFKLIFFKY